MLKCINTPIKYKALEMMPWEEILFLMTAFFTEVIGTMVGFGSSTIFIPIALLFVDFRTALILVAISHMSGGIGRITFFRRGLDKRLLMNFGLPSVLLTLLGSLLVSYVPTIFLKLVLGVFLITFSLMSLFKVKLKISSSLKNSFVGGGLSGFFAGLIGTGGVLRGAFLTSFDLEKSVYIATTAVISLAVDATRIPVYIGNGFLDPQYYYLIPILFLLAIAGSFAGRRIVNVIPQPIFRKFVLVMISLLSLMLVYDGIIYLVSL